MTATSQASDAAERLREIVKPGGTVWAISRGFTRAGVEKVTLHVPRSSEQYPESARWDITAAVAGAIEFRLVQRTYCLGLDESVTLRKVINRLSVALFAEPGLIKGEYL